MVNCAHVRFDVIGFDYMVPNCYEKMKLSKTGSQYTCYVDPYSVVFNMLAVFIKALSIASSIFSSLFTW